MSNASHSCRKRAPCRNPGNRSPRQVMRIVRDHAHRPTLDANERRNHADPELLSNLQHRPHIGDRVDHLAHVIEPQPILRHHVPQPPLVGRLPFVDRALEVAEVLLRDLRRSSSSLVRMSTTPFGTWNDIGPTSSGVYTPRPPPSIIAGPPIATVEPSVAMITSQQASSARVAREAAPVRHATSGISPLSFENCVNV